MQYVYLIRNKVTGKGYIGRTKDWKKRWDTHLARMRKNCHANVHLQRSFNKHGEMAFELFILKRTRSEEKAKAVEDKYIKENLHRCYNILKSGYEGGDTTTLHPDRKRIVAQRAETTKANRALLSTEERQRIWGKFGERNGMFGRTHSEETRKKLSKAHKGLMKGIPKGPMSDETKEKLSIAHKEFYASGGVNPFQGKTHTEEVRKRISEANKGKKHESIMSAVQIGKKRFESVSAAARELDVCKATVVYRIKSKYYPDYKYLTRSKQWSKCPTTIENTRKRK